MPKLVRNEKGHAFVCDGVKTIPWADAEPKQRALAVLTSEPETLSDITCDACGAFVCMVDDLDLEGSYFFCTKCAPQLKAKG